MYVYGDMRVAHIYMQRIKSKSSARPSRSQLWFKLRLGSYYCCCRLPNDAFHFRVIKGDIETSKSIDKQFEVIDNIRNSTLNLTLDQKTKVQNKHLNPIEQKTYTKEFGNTGRNRNDSSLFPATKQ